LTQLGAHAAAVRGQSAEAAFGAAGDHARGIKGGAEGVRTGRGPTVEFEAAGFEGGDGGVLGGAAEEDELARPADEAGGPALEAQRRF
jgi:hypothetical protein